MARGEFLGKLLLLTVSDKKMLGIISVKFAAARGKPLQQQKQGQFDKSSGAIKRGKTKTGKYGQLSLRF